MNITTIGIDIAKNFFQLYAVDARGKKVFEKRLTREKLLPFIANTPICHIVMEACGGANYWAREFKKIRHEVNLIAPQFVVPFRTGNKNDRNDAQAIVEAASRPQMRFVQVKTIEQQDMQSILRVRESYVEMRTKMSNQIRGLLTEYGIVIPQGVHHLKRVLPDLLDRLKENNLTLPMKELLERQYFTLQYIEEQISYCDKRIEKIAKENEACQRLQKVEGVGPITSVAVIATVGFGTGFKNGRHFAAYLGLVPRQHSSGNREKLLGISKRGDSYLRKLFIHGGRSVVSRAQKKRDARSCWTTQLKTRAGTNRASVAVANKNARIVMALLLSGKDYRRAA